MFNAPYKNELITYYYYICDKYEDNLDHLLFQCPFLERARNLVKVWLEIAGTDQDTSTDH